jgi:hypothetical protein
MDHFNGVVLEFTRLNTQLRSASMDRRVCDIRPELASRQVSAVAIGISKRGGIPFAILGRHNRDCVDQQ